MFDRVSVSRLPIGLAIALAISTSLAATAPATAYAADPTATTGPSIQYQEALAHSAKTYSFAPGGPVTVPFRPRSGDSAMVDGAAPEALSAAQGSSAVAPKLTAPSIVTPNSTLSALRREVLGFLPYWEVGSTLNYDTISTVAYFGVDLNGDGTLNKSSNGWNGWNGSTVTSMINDAHAHGTRVALSVESFAWDAGGAATQSAVLSSPAVSLAAAQQIAAEVGQDNLRTVWAAVRSGRAAYQPTSGPNIEFLGHGGSDWRRLLDLLEQTTGRSLVPIWRDWVVSSSQTGLLLQRSATLDAYAVAQTAAGSWNLPPDIRRSLDNWEFDQATAFMGEARVILNQREEIAAAAALEGVAPPPTLESAFETAGIITASSEATSELAVLNELASARQARSSEGEGVARSVGLIGTDPEANLEAARAAFSKGDLARAQSLAAAARSSWEGASTSGQVRVIGAMCVLAGVVMLLLLFVWTRGGRSRPGPRAADGEVVSEPVG